jgi:hypothetical protein
LQAWESKQQLRAQEQSALRFALHRKSQLCSVWHGSAMLHCCLFVQDGEGVQNSTGLSSMDVPARQPGGLAANRVLFAEGPEAELAAGDRVDIDQEVYAFIKLAGGVGLSGQDINDFLRIVHGTARPSFRTAAEFRKYEARLLSRAGGPYKELHGLWS